MWTLLKSWFCTYVLTFFSTLLAGIPHSDPAALQLAKEISETEGMELTGIYAHCGNTYGCKGEEQIKAVAQETTTIVLQFVEKYASSSTSCFSENGLGYYKMVVITISESFPCSIVLCFFYFFVVIYRLKTIGIQDVKSSIGSTPSCSHPVPDMAMLSEVHPGNYVFYGKYGQDTVKFPLLDICINRVLLVFVVQMCSSPWLAPVVLRTLQ